MPLLSVPMLPGVYVVRGRGHVVRDRGQCRQGLCRQGLEPFALFASRYTALVTVFVTVFGMVFVICHGIRH